MKSVYHERLVALRAEIASLTQELTQLGSELEDILFRTGNSSGLVCTTITGLPSTPERVFERAAVFRDLGERARQLRF